MNGNSALQPDELQATSVPRWALRLGERYRAVPHGYLQVAAVVLSAYVILMHFTIGTRGEQFIGAAVMLSALFWNEDTRRIGLGIAPVVFTGISYDLTHIAAPLVRHLHVHVAEPYLAEKAIFGVHVAGRVMTLNELFQRHHWPVVDLVTGTSYIVFLYWALGFPLVLLTQRRRPAWHRVAIEYAWTYLGVSLAAYATYYIYPAAPPWYVTDHGLGPVDFSVHASAAGALRWDQLTGIHYFEHFYARSAEIFGAIPSLHVAHPLLVFLYGRLLKKRWFNFVSFGFYALVCFSAVYLQHHYIFDLALGSAYALAGYAMQRAVSAIVRERSAALSQAGAGR